MNRNKIIKLLGNFPEKIDPNPKVIKSENKGTHLLQTISYNVEPSERVDGYLLIPNNIKKRSPTILALHQHAGIYDIGKSESAGLKGKSTYFYGLELCKRGYVVFCPDHLCFEDRIDKDLDGAAYELFVFTKYLLNGSTLQTKYISDLVCALNVLETFDVVDKNRIGIIGHSLGGQETLWFMWYDKRVKVGVSSCGFSEITEIINKKINHNLAMYVPNLLNNADIGDIVSSLAPRPFMMISGKSDPIFPTKGVNHIEKKAKKTYKEKNASQNFSAIYFEGQHNFPKNMREVAYKWIDYHLK